MRELLLFRHAKSRWDEPGVDDHDRDLAPRGLEAAPRMGVLLRAQGLVPDLALVSTARRARRTWELAAAALDPAPPVRVEQDLYHASPEQLLRHARAQADSFRRLIVVGHNPGFEQLARLLTGPGSPHDPAGNGEKFPTGAIAWIAFAVEHWAAAGPERATLRGFFRPKDWPPDAPRP